MDHSIERKQRRHFENGEVIFREGDPGTEMYVVFEGKVEIYRDSDGSHTQLATLGPDSFFGEMALFDDRPRSASAKAVGPVEVRVVNESTFAMMPCDPVINQLLITLAERLRTMDDVVEKLSEESEARHAFMSSRMTQQAWLT